MFAKHDRICALWRFVLGAKHQKKHQKQNDIKHNVSGFISFIVLLIFSQYSLFHC